MAKKTIGKGSDQRKIMTWIGALVAGVSIVAACLVAGAIKAWRATISMAEFRVRPADAVIAAPFIRPEPFRQDLLRTDASGVLSREYSLFTPGLARQVADAYAASPWVRKVIEVRKVFPNRLEVRLDLREPFAEVVFRGRRCCVDREGVALSPGIYQLTEADLAPLGPKIIVADDLPAPVAGMVWNDAAVQGGIAMVSLCREQFDGSVGVEAVEMERFADERGRAASLATLVLRSGTRVQWGRAPVGPPSAAEISTPQKAAALRAILAKEGPNIGRLGVINVRWHPTLVRAKE